MKAGNNNSFFLGVDPGFGRTGWGIVESIKGKEKMIDFGCVETYPKSSIDSRISQIFDKISSLIKNYKPAALALEELFFGTNVTTALKVGETRGVIMLAAHQKNIPLFFYKPPEVKLAVTGNGISDKKQIQRMVKLILKLDTIPEPDDAADALAIALTHAFSQKMKGLK